MSGGRVTGALPPKNEIFFFFPKSLYMVETTVAGEENVRGGVRMVSPLKIEIVFFAKMILYARDKGNRSERCLGEW
jgi:hypothetical protein